MATPVCPPWAPDAWALVAGMYWLYGCWKIHNHKHTLHCCTLRTPTLMLFLHGPPPKISIYCRDLFDFLRTCACVDGCGKLKRIKQRRSLLSTTATRFFLSVPAYEATILPATSLHRKSFIRTTFIWPKGTVSYFSKWYSAQSIFMIWDVSREDRLLLLSLHKCHTSFSMSPK